MRGHFDRHPHAYNPIRLEIAKAALDSGHAPNDLSFIRAFHIIQYEMTWAAAVEVHYFR